MRKITYLGFFRGAEVTIREVLKVEQLPENNATYFDLALHQTDEVIHIGIKSEYASLVKPNAILFYPNESSETIGYTIWKNGLGSLGIKLPEGSLNSDT